MRMKNRKTISLLLLVLFSGIGIFFLVPTVHAQGGLGAAISDTMGNIVGGIIGLLISALGVILALVIKVLVIVAQYSDFIDSAAVTAGWKIVRDLCNMFFVLVLLIIAFATILKIENYSYKKYLPKLILMAILINFSKTICGLLIDFSQVIMLTFVNAFKDVAGGNLITNLGIIDVLTIAKSSSDVGFWAIISAYVLGLIYVLIALVVIVTMLAMLVMRIVMIWIYVVLSPAAYLFSAFPGGQKYASQWWDEFTKNLIVGPVLAFFIWLSFISLQAPGALSGFNSDNSTAASLGGTMGIDTSSATDKNPDGTPFAASSASTPGVLIKFVIGIGMLIGGLKVSQQIGGAAGSIAGKGMAAIQKGTAFAGKGLKRVANGDNYLARKFAKSTGWDFRPVKIAENFKAAMKTSKMKDEAEINKKARKHFDAGGIESLVMGAGAGEDYFHRYTDGFLATKGIKRAVTDVFVSPKKRKELGGQIDQVESETKELNENKSDIEMTHEEGIKNRMDTIISGDTVLSDAQDEKKANIQRVEELNNKSSLTSAEDTEIKNLKSKNDTLSKQLAGVRKQAEEEYYSNIDKRRPSMQTATDKAVKKDQGLIDLDKELSQNSIKIGKLEMKKAAAGKLSFKDEQGLAGLKRRNDNITEEKKTKREEVEKQARKDYVAKVTGVGEIDAKLKIKEEDLHKIKEELEKYQKPMALQSRAQYRNDIEEAKKKYKTLTNSDEKLKALADAKERGDKFDQVAILESLSSDGNFNEVLKSKGYKSKADGIYALLNNQENDDKEKRGLTGFNKSEILDIMNDIGESEERVNHWASAKLVGMNSKGEMESTVKEKKDSSGNVIRDKDGHIQYDDSVQAKAAYTEIMKMDPQKAVTSLNRLAYGGEDGHGKFELATVGKMIYKSFMENGTYISQKSRIQTNLASNLSASHIVPELQRLGRNESIQTSETIKAIKEKGSDGRLDAFSMLNSINKG